MDTYNHKIIDLKNISIKQLYKIALLEGEGLGTAYEYFVKLRLLNKEFRNSIDKQIKTILIYGLPKKYGFSMDFLIFCRQLGIIPDVYDNRIEKIKNHKQIILEIKNKLDFKIECNYISETNKKYDLILSCEVLQRYSGTQLKEFVNKVEEHSKCYAIFVPNKNNEKHAKVSGLNSFNEDELKNVFNRSGIIGFMDAPPFPPGKRAKKKVNNELIIKILEVYSWFEWLINKKNKHIIYHIKKL